MDKILLIVDLQKEFADKDNNSVSYNKTLKYIKDNVDSYNEVISTIFRNNNMNYIENLEWKECINVNTDSLEYYPLNNCLHHNIIFKSGYGDNERILINTIRKVSGATDDQEIEIHIIGCDLDACVMAICFQLWDAEINFKVLTDYCYTTAKEFSKEDIIKIMKRNFGKCIIENNK